MIADVFEQYAKKLDRKWEVNYYTDEGNRQYKDHKLDCCIEMYYNDSYEFDGLYEIWINTNDISKLTINQINGIVEQSVEGFIQAVEDKQDLIIYVIFENDKPTVVFDYV